MQLYITYISLYQISDLPTSNQEIPFSLFGKGNLPIWLLRFITCMEEGMYYVAKKQLCSYCTADLHLCFCICRFGFSGAAAHL